MLKMPSNSDAKNVIFKEKKIGFATCICTRDLMFANYVLYQLSYFPMVLSGMLLEFSPLLQLQPAAE